MKAFLRADPDIIMVGEMRDAETTGIGIEASLTGHLVFATLHTNSAPESIIRLLDMGMDPFNFADAARHPRPAPGQAPVQGMQGRLPADARRDQAPAHRIQRRAGHTDRWAADPEGGDGGHLQEWVQRYAKDGKFTLYKARGCPACGDTGYEGPARPARTAGGTDPVKKLIQEKARVAEILAVGSTKACGR